MRDKLFPLLLPTLAILTAIPAQAHAQDSGLASRIASIVVTKPWKRNAKIANAWFQNGGPVPNGIRLDERAPRCRLDFLSPSKTKTVPATPLETAPATMANTPGSDNVVKLENNHFIRKDSPSGRDFEDQVFQYVVRWPLKKNKPGITAVTCMVPADAAKPRALTEAELKTVFGDYLRIALEKSSPTTQNATVGAAKQVDGGVKNLSGQSMPAGGPSPEDEDSKPGKQALGD